jgi:hypothetical protein
MKLATVTLLLPDLALQLVLFSAMGSVVDGKP